MGFNTSYFYIETNSISLIITCATLIYLTSRQDIRETFGWLIKVLLFYALGTVSRIIWMSLTVWYN